MRSFSLFAREKHAFWLLTFDFRMILSEILLFTGVLCCFSVLELGMPADINVQRNISTFRRLYQRSKNYIDAQKNISTFTLIRALTHFLQNKKSTHLYVRSFSSESPFIVSSFIRKTLNRQRKSHLATQHPFPVLIDSRNFKNQPVAFLLFQLRLQRNDITQKHHAFKAD